MAAASAAGQAPAHTWEFGGFSAGEEYAYDVCATASDGGRTCTTLSMRFIERVTHDTKEVWIMHASVGNRTGVALVDGAMNVHSFAGFGLADMLGDTVMWMHDEIRLRQIDGPYIGWHSGTSSPVTGEMDVVITDITIGDDGASTYTIAVSNMYASADIEIRDGLALPVRGEIWSSIMLSGRNSVTSFEMTGYGSRGGGGGHGPPGDPAAAGGDGGMQGDGPAAAADVNVLEEAPGVREGGMVPPSGPAATAGGGGGMQAAASTLTGVRDAGAAGGNSGGIMPPPAGRQDGGPRAAAGDAAVTGHGGDTAAAGGIREVETAGGGNGDGGNDHGHDDTAGGIREVETAGGGNDDGGGPLEAVSRLFSTAADMMTAALWSW